MKPLNKLKQYKTEIIIWIVLSILLMLFMANRDNKIEQAKEIALNPITANIQEMNKYNTAVWQEIIDIRELRLKKAEINKEIDFKKENVTILEQAILELKIENNNLSYNLD